MLGPEMKELAQAHSLTLDYNIAYGDLHGYAVTLSEGADYKLIAITTKFTDPDRRQELKALVRERQRMKEFRIQEITFSDAGIVIQFGRKSMKQLLAFVDWFFPLLPKYTACGVHTCGHCGRDLGGKGDWKLINGAAYHLHTNCAKKIQEEARQQQLRRQEQAQSGSHLNGFLGALAGGFVGVLPWVLLLNQGLRIFPAAALTGLLAAVGYKVVRGGGGNQKTAILTVVTTLCALVGTLLVDVLAMAQLIGAGEMPYYGYHNIPSLILYLLQVDSGYRTTTLVNLGMAVLFALLGLGAFALWQRREEKPADIRDLERVKPEE